MKLGQKFAYEHGITFQSDQRMHILIYQTEEVFNYIGFLLYWNEDDSTFEASFHDRVSGQKFIHGSKITEQVDQNRTYCYTQLIGHSIVLSLFCFEIYIIKKSPSTLTWSQFLHMKMKEFQANIWSEVHTWI